MFEQGVRRLDATLAAGNINQEQYARQLDLITLRYNAGLAAAAKNEQALRSLSAGSGQAAVSTGQLRFAVQNLGFQLNDIATSLATGASPFRILAQQGGQVVQAFQQGGGVSTVLAATARGISSLVTPTTAAAAGIVALGAAFAAGLSRLTSTQQNVKDFELTLSALGEDGKTSGAALQQAFQQIRDSGTSASDALMAVRAIARDPLINQQRAEEVIKLARDISSVTGDTLPEAQQKLQNALGGGSTVSSNSGSPLTL
jgi:Prophage tail length tape measure protein